MNPIENTFTWVQGPVVVLGENRLLTNEAAMKVIDSFGGRNFVYLRDYGNDIHYKQIELTVRSMYGMDRTAIVTTMNPFVMDCLYFRSANEVRERFLFVRDSIVHTLTDEEACLFYNAYVVGIQYVSEILRTQGLW